MTEAQTQLQNALTTTFLANLVFLSEYDNELYHRVDELSRMIENGSYEEKYHLEFIMEDGEFDIFDVVNDKYLYNRKPKKRNNELVRKVEFDNKFSIINFSEHFLEKTSRFKLDFERRFEFTTINELTNITFNDLFEYSNYLKDNLDTKKNKKIKKIDKFIFLGTLLGRHIPKIAKKIDAKMYLVLERNLEIFRLSLFTVDYTILAKNGVVFSIMDDNQKELTHITKFLNTSMFDNYLLKFSTTSLNIESYIDTILSTISSLNPESYDYNRILYTYINRSTKYLNKYKTPMFKNIQNSCDIFKHIPILYIAAGPSFGENIKWIKENQNKFFIVTVGSALKKLLDNDIRVDMITSVDEKDVIEKIQFDDDVVSKIDKKTITLMSTLTYEKLLKKLNQNNLFLFEVFLAFYKQNISFSGFSVGEVTLNMLTKLNPKEIYLLGLDLALNQKTGDSHSEGANSSTIRVNLDEEQSRETFSHRTSLIKIKGNFEEVIFTNPSFYSSVKSVDNVLSKKSEDLNIYNLSTHGAYFLNTIPKKIEDIKLSNIKNINSIRDNLHKYLDKHSKTSLDNDTLEVLQEEYDFVNKYIYNFLEELEYLNFKNFEEFKDKIYEILKKTLETKNSLLYQILFGYYSMLIPYLSYYFNDIKLKNENKKLKKITSIFIDQISRICEDYLMCLKRVL